MATSTVGEVELNLVEKGQLVESLWHSVDHTSGNLEIIPGLVRRIIETGAWRERVHKGKRYKHKHFIDFIREKPLSGCGWPPEKVEMLIKNDLDILALWRDATTAPKGGDPKSRASNTDNVSVGKPEHGNSRAYTLSRLMKQKPELYEKVISGGMSANAAAKEAGWRKEPSGISLLRWSWKKATEEERETFRKEIIT